jgi:predicted nucleic acid-binding protein
VIFVDSNVPMYLVGSDADVKASASEAVQRAILAGDRLVTSAEVLQEMLHRYHAIRRRDAIEPALEAMLGLVDDVFPIEESSVLAAKDVLVANERLSARDAIHVAVMRTHGVRQILSFDRGFDLVDEIERINL